MSSGCVDLIHRTGLIQNKIIRTNSTRVGVEYYISYYKGNAK